MVSNSAYGANSAEIAELFSDYLEGDGAQPAFVLSRQPLNSVARNAVEKSLEHFGYSPQSCTYATTVPRNPDIEGGDIPLDAQALFVLIEGLDPIFVIAADTDAVAAIARSYRIDVPKTESASARIFGRPGALFQDLSNLLQTETGKQKAWRTFKTLNS